MHRNSVYGHGEWKKHKSSWRHVRHVCTILSSGLIRAIGPPVFLCTLVSVFVAVINHCVDNGVLPSWFPVLKVATLPFTLTSPVLALLLVFRTNTSYQRFDEARKAWGSNVNRARDLARQALTWIRNPGDSKKLQCLLRYTKAYSFCLMHHLREEGCLRKELEATIVNEEEVECVMNSKNRPIWVLQVISDIINECQITPWERIAMDKNITQFHDNVGACERIFKTPIPVAYTRLTSRVLTLWHLVLPFALWETCGWHTITVSFVSSAALFYIEEVGVMIEEPFSILALSTICTGIVAALEGLSNAHTDALILVWGIVEQQWSTKADHLMINLK
ncbi:voltage-dependent chloride channel 2, chloroplastic [Physcomitrium patens]|uniref:Uncharacterized protein n=1 Tax=Physcomitrium patens TaxID=3218 RepID=A0A2K1KGY5_PHYPA|nr:UPF0187 protein At2g45870, chloroplastic-like [Physcomitrium patens]PNR53037.1 hypothetical protein PHYPA_009412 [Physcomitrium patens]|eukprot:XP_024378525.1 UPF0187 protein At2g45870, chloroplastic-like [Physcomitrella patens]